MEKFIDSISETLGQYVPTVIGALIIFAVGFLLARLLKMGIARGLTSIGLDSTMKEKTGRDLGLAALIANVVFYLIILYVTLMSLGVLGIEGVLDPAKQMLAKFLDMIPNVIAAGLIGVAGYIIARIISGAVLIISVGLDKFSAKLGFGEDFKISKLLGTFTFVLILVPVLISALDALKIASISEPATAMLQKLLDFVPNLIAAGVILGVALIVGRFVRNIIVELLKNAGTDTAAEKIGASQFCGAKGASSAIGNLVLFFIMLGASLSAVEALQLDRLADAFGSLLAFTGNVVIGLFIIAVGSWLAGIAYTRMHKDGQPTLSAGIARIAILGFVLALGLRAMGIGEDIVNLAFGLTLGAVAVAVALSFGLGGREAAGKQMDHWLAKWRGGN